MFAVMNFFWNLYIWDSNTGLMGAQIQTLIIVLNLINCISATNMFKI